MRLHDKVILVTASTRGIGLAIVRKCACEGATVFMAARDLPAAREKAAAMGANVRCVYHDATKPETYAQMIREVVERVGRIDGLVNNFGTSDPKRDLDLAHTDAEVFLQTVQRNLGSVFLGSQAAVRVMAENGGGSIVNISSVGGSVPDVSQIGYGTGKAAINYLTRLIALQEARNGIRCNAILPGMTGTDAVNANLTDAFRARFLRHIPLRRIGTPEEIAAAAVYFLSDDSAYTTGQTLTVSGGFGLGTPLYGELLDQTERR